ncbi:MAG: DEAD/DEAH box helicase family protein [Verrucomicrobiia bacterium]
MQKDIYLKKKNNLIVGSSNLTASALSSNTELNIKITATQESKTIKEVIKEFDSEFSNSVQLDEKFISEYESVYKEIERRRSQVGVDSIQNKSSVVIPNSMQCEALKNLESQRKRGVDKSLLISATGTGKTFLAAFDVQASGAQKVLFVVHRLNITQKAMESFKRIFGDQKTMGLYSGQNREKEADFRFSTVQTINREEHLKQFSKDYFDYIIIDETHRAGAKTYQKILDHFRPKFILGMTATPERTDGYDIFSLFDHNIAYEIRLQKAMKENLLCPFHYFGVF